MIPRLSLFALLAALAQPALAGTPIDQTRPLDPRGTVEIGNLKGRIEVRVWDRAEVHVGGTLGAGVEKLVVEGTRDRLVVRAQYPKRMGWGSGSRTEPTTLLLKVPTLASLEIESVAADVDVSGTAGRALQVENVSGDVSIAGAPRKAQIESVSGDLTLTLNSDEVQVESVSGDIRLRGRLDGEIRAETVSGNLAVDSRGERVRRISTATVSGDVRMKVALAPGGVIRAESVSGDLTLVLPRSLSARATGESFSGTLRAAGAGVEKPKYGPGSSFSHRYGDGDGEIRIETFSGDAELILE
ncbi:DUF4097 family beta strand repeat-containing protein [Vulcaniibacterium gelatinicum]|uniref:DUF4097 family beta strand repeat-containing protein n=1 Tax=Vulcaniibacterium gelatinicum TaxID=2598725 RepID=UPI0011CC1BE7|nr:DUF4097 family beta strand repeat-containing protein [Vulcaniibacterium gelatinicum]